MSMLRGEVWVSAGIHAAALEQCRFHRPQADRPVFPTCIEIAGRFKPDNAPLPDISSWISAVVALKGYS